MFKTYVFTLKKAPSNAKSRVSSKFIFANCVLVWSRDRLDHTFCMVLLRKSFRTMSVMSGLVFPMYSSLRAKEQRVAGPITKAKASPDQKTAWGVTS